MVKSSSFNTYDITIWMYGALVVFGGSGPTLNRNWIVYNYKTGLENLDVGLDLFHTA